MSGGQGALGKRGDSHNRNARNRGSCRGHENIANHVSRTLSWTRGHVVIPQGGEQKGITPGPSGF